MEKFFIDKSKMFECNVNVEGADIDDTKARLILQFNESNLLFYGKIDSSGKCNIPIPPIKNIKESKGKVILEIIADQTHFEPWTSDFTLEQSKKVKVEISENKEINDGKPKIKITGLASADKDTKAIVESFAMYLKTNSITIDNIKTHKKKLLSLMEKFITKNKLGTTEIKSLYEGISGVADYLD